MIGSKIGGRYRIVKELGKGAFGQTYLAQDTNIPGNPQCVVKHLKPQADDELTLREARRLFKSEAIVLSKLNHPQIPRLLAHYQEDFHLVQEFISGHDLNEEIYPGKIWQESEVKELLLDVLPILEFIHQQNVIHRDVKPSNLVRRESDQKLVLIDFGAVKEIKTLMLASGGQAVPSVVVGTRGYMPTEQLKGRPRPNSDIYALGVMAILALTGLALTELEEDEETGELIWEQHAQVSKKLAAIINRMVHSDYLKRYSSATEAIQDLAPTSRSWLRKDRPKKRDKLGCWLGLGLTVVTLVGVGLLYSPVRAIYLFNQAKGLSHQGKYREAISLHNQILDTYPHATNSLVEKGYALSKLGRIDEMLDACMKAVEIKVDFVEALNCQGLALQKLGRNEEALQAYTQVVELQRDFYAAWNNRGETLMHLRRYPEALESFEKAILYNQDYLFAWNNRGNVLFSMQRYPEAVAAYDKAISLDSNYKYAWNGRGNARRSLKRYQDAISDYNHAIALDGRFYEAWYNKGLALINLEENEMAFAAFSEAITIKPDYGAAIQKREEVRRRLNF